MRQKVLATIFIVAFWSLCMGSDWIRLGPVAGTVLDIAVDRVHPSAIYCINGSQEFGRLYRSTDSGGAWLRTPIDRAQSVVVDPASSELFVLSISQDDSTHQLWWSSDYGKSFTLQSWKAPSRIFAHPFNPSILLGIDSSTPGWVVISFDRGRKWAPAPNMPYQPERTYAISPYCTFQRYEIHDILISPFDGQTIYVSTAAEFTCGSHDHDEFELLLHGKKLGQTWAIEEFNSYNFSYDPAFPNRAFAFHNDFGGGTSKLKILTQKGWRFLSYQAVTRLASMPGRPDELFAYHWNQGYGAAEHFVSRDLGRTWKTIQMGPGNGIRRMVGIRDGMLIGGTEGGGLYFLGEKSSWKSSQNGLNEATLIDVAAGPPFSLLYVIARGEACCGSDSYLYRSMNLGKTWRNITDNIPTKNTAAKGLWGLASDLRDPKHVIIQAGNRFAVSFDAGETWKFLAQDRLLVAFFHPTRDHEVYFTSWNRIFKSKDGGVSAEPLPLNLGNPYVAFTEICFDRFTDDLYIGSDAGMYVSTDGGRTMRPIGPEKHDHYCEWCWVSDIVQLSGQGQFLIAAASGIYKTMDSGATWQRLSSTPDYYPKIYIADSQGQHLFVIRDSVNESTDGGKTWKNIAVEIDPHLTRNDLTTSAMTNPQVKPWFISTRVGLYSQP